MSQMTGSSASWRLLLLTFPALIIILACNTLTDGAVPSPESQSGEVTFEAEIVFGPGDFIYTDTRAGLAELSTYRATLTFDFDGTRDGTPEKWSRTYTMLAANEPQARQWSIEQSEGSSDPESVFMAELDGMD